MKTFVSFGPFPSRLFSFIVLFFFLFHFSLPLFAAEEYEELRYDDLVRQLSSKKDPFGKRTLSSDSPMIHAGFGIVSINNQIRYADQVRSRPLNGFQMSAGIDLFSTAWMAEGIFRNFANHTSGTETRSLREIDWRLLNRIVREQDLEMRIALGFGNRTYKLNDSNGFSFDQETMVGLVSVEMIGNVSRNFGVGLEGGLRSALISQTNDINSIDLTLKMETLF